MPCPPELQVGCLRTELRRDVTLPYLLRPGDPAAPVLLWLHGAGQKGLPPEALAGQAILAATAQHAPELSVCCPCCPAERSGWRVEELLLLIEQLGAGRPIILGGSSMGGRGAYELAYDHADRLAALIAIAAVGLPTLAPRLHGLPLWIAHGSADAVVPVERAREMAAALPQAQYHELPGSGHACTREVLDAGTLWHWLRGILDARWR